MSRRRLIWKLYPAYLVVLLLSIGAAGLYVHSAVRDFYLRQTPKDLQDRTALIADRLGQDLPDGPSDALDAQLRRLDGLSHTRITIVRADGVVLGESRHDAHTMEDHADRPDFQQALSTGTGTSIRYSDTLHTDMEYAARAITRNGRTVAVVRAALPLSEIGAGLWAVDLQLALGGALLAVLGALAGLAIFSRVVARPLGQIKHAALEFARGELTHPIPGQNAEEFGGLADALNGMAGQLNEKIRTITQQSHEQQAVLSSMIEGVMAVDTDERLLSLNAAAATFLGVDPTRAIGRRIQEVIRNTQLQRFVARALSSHDPVEGDIVLPGDDEERFLQAHGTVLRDAGAQGIGALVVLNDVTRLRRLENIRRDFVANVSHELKTPVTSIKGFIETLREGAIRDPERAEQFLVIIARQADRLNAIIEDLLRLSRIEQENERAQVELAPLKLRDVLQSAAGDCQGLAADRRVTLKLTCPPDLVARVNGPLLEQAVVNLLDNAIKYSEPGAPVELEAQGDANEVRIHVRDNGSGIPAEHLPRIFERFYRVDKARSRKLGGTGLGLAIVKHIAQAHRGSISVQSTVGKGSTFTLHIPVMAAQEVVETTT